MGTNEYEQSLSVYLDNLLEEARVVFPVSMNSLLVEDLICMGLHFNHSGSLSFHFKDSNRQY